MLVEVVVGNREFASRSGGGNSQVKNTTISKSMRPSLPTMNSTTTASSPPVCSTITEQYQQQQDGHNSAFQRQRENPIRLLIGLDPWRRRLAEAMLMLNRRWIPLDGREEGMMKDYYLLCLYSHLFHHFFLL